jgi:hypothetical protein
MNSWIVGLTLLTTLMAPLITKYRVTVKADDHVDFAALHTYAWTSGWEMFDPTIDRHIVVAVDRELASLGLVRRQGPPCDVLVAYGALRRTDVDTHTRVDGKGTPFVEHPVGTLVVRMLEPGSRREWLRARADVPADEERGSLDAQVDDIVRRMFRRYPTRDHGQ